MKITLSGRDFEVSMDIPKMLRIFFNSTIACSVTPKTLSLIFAALPASGTTGVITPMPGNILKRNFSHKYLSIVPISKIRLKPLVIGLAQTRITHDGDVVERNNLGIAGVKNHNRSSLTAQDDLHF